MDYSHMITRTAFCNTCNARNRPKKNDWFIAFGTTHDTVLIKQSHHEGTPGFTPHLIIWNVKAPLVEGKIQTIMICGMQDCGVKIDLEGDHPEGKVPIAYLEAKVHNFTEAQLQAIMNFKNSGYEIF